MDALYILRPRPLGNLRMASFRAPTRYGISSPVFCFLVEFLRDSNFLLWLDLVPYPGGHCDSPHALEYIVLRSGGLCVKCVFDITIVNIQRQFS
jgi:hypothetical protein